ncbi:Nucleolar protein 56 [Araneus ventricosus]|uniref:Nucleolar protein 56 n=1 Tax=Araneus ventricosus TaxID=182803 RepID=A0A4Y2MF54_ARAVE|nr:Nucleolar protein 56 [Araneus ventricosus]
MTGHIYRDVILEQHVRLFRGAMGAEFLFMDDNARPHRANIVDECLQSEDITRMDWPAYSPDLNPIEHHQLYVLFESASGYGLFRTTEFEEVAMFMPEVQGSILDISKFRSIVFLHAFHPFETVSEAFDNMQCIMKGKLHMDLHIFLENNVPKAKKGKQAVVLGVSDPALSMSITDTLDIACNTSGVVMEVIRGIRFHFPKLIKGYKDQATVERSQLGLSHHYARIKLKVKFDRLVPQTVDMSDQLAKDINTLGSRVRRWYSLHFPELSTIVPDVQSYVKCVKEIKNRKCMSENVADALQDIVNDSEKVQKIVEAARTSMGMDISEEDIENIENCIEQIFSLMKRRDETNDYLNSKMRQIAPNLSALIGEKVGAQLISQAGSLTSLAKFPSSTVQILGAQKSLFRTLKSKGCKDNFVALMKKTLIRRHLKGRSERYISNKCALAARIDCFRVIPTDEFGVQMSQQVQAYKIKKLGLRPELNEEMKAAVAAKKSLKRKLKKERRHKKKAVAEQNDVEMEETPSEQVSEQKKKKRKSKICKYSK